jgi:hypothetical protein
VLALIRLIQAEFPHRVVRHLRSFDPPLPRTFPQSMGVVRALCAPSGGLVAWMGIGHERNVLGGSMSCYVTDISLDHGRHINLLSSKTRANLLARLQGRHRQPARLPRASATVAPRRSCSPSMVRTLHYGGGSMAKTRRPWHQWRRGGNAISANSGTGVDTAPSGYRL